MLIKTISTAFLCLTTKRNDGAIALPYHFHSLRTSVHHDIIIERHEKDKGMKALTRTTNKEKLILPSVAELKVKNYCERKRLLTIHLLRDRSGTEVTRESTDSSNCFNGGDYNEWIEYKEFWQADRCSCDMNSGRDEMCGGRLFGVPVIIVFPVYSSFPIGIVFADKSKLEITKEEWNNSVSPNWKEVVSSDWGVDFNFKRCPI